MRRDWSNIRKYYKELLEDVYPQPEDVGHTAWAKEIIDKWIPLLHYSGSVLDVGCGVGFCQPLFEFYGISYTGVAIGQDVIDAQKLGHNVIDMDMNFLEYPDESFGMIFSRHSLEHSPFVLLTLMEWWRVATNWLFLILPAPKYWKYVGQNHYCVMETDQAKFLLSRAGWRPIWEDLSDEHELRFMCERYDRANLDRLGQGFVDG